MNAVLKYGKAYIEILKILEILIIRYTELSVYRLLPRSRDRSYTRTVLTRVQTSAAGGSDIMATTPVPSTGSHLMDKPNAKSVAWDHFRLEKGRDGKPMPCQSCFLCTSLSVVLDCLKVCKPHLDFIWRKKDITCNFIFSWRAIFMSLVLLSLHCRQSR